MVLARRLIASCNVNLLSVRILHLGIVLVGESTCECDEAFGMKLPQHATGRVLSRVLCTT